MQQFRRLVDSIANTNRCLVRRATAEGRKMRPSVRCVTNCALVRMAPDHHMCAGSSAATNGLARPRPELTDCQRSSALFVNGQSREVPQIERLEEALLAGVSRPPFQAASSGRSRCRHETAWRVLAVPALRRRSQRERRRPRQPSTMSGNLQRHLMQMSDGCSVAVAGDRGSLA